MTNRLTGVVELLEEHLWNYHTNDDVARLDDLSKHLSGEEIIEGLSTKDAFHEFLDIQDDLVQKALWGMQCTHDRF